MDKMKLIDFLETLRDGINTHTGEVCQDKAFFEDESLQKNFDRIIRYIRNSKFVQHKPIILYPEKLEKIVPSFKMIELKKFSDVLVKATNLKTSKIILEAMQEYLVSYGFLYINATKSFKKSTKKGEEFGILNEPFEIDDKRLNRVIFSPRGQEFIIECFPEIVNDFNKNL